jgi:hypothetical protein
VKKQWEVWTYVHDKPFRMEKRTWTRWGGQRWANKYPAHTVTISPEKGPEPIYTMKVKKRDTVTSSPDYAKFL